MNAKNVILNIVEEEIKVVEKIRFHIQRKVEKWIYFKRHSFY